MHKKLEWAQIATPLDVREIFPPRQTIQRWLGWQRKPGGMIFDCALSGGELVEYHVDVIQPDVLRLRWNLDHVAERPSDMLVQTPLPSAPFEWSESSEMLVLSTSAMRVEFPRVWQIRAYVGERLFFSERTDDRAYGPGFEVAPSGYDIGEDQRLSARMSIAVNPGESFYGLGEKFTSLDKWGQEHTLWATDSGNVSSYRSYKNIPFLLSSQGYGLFVHASFPMVFRIGSESNITYSIHIADTQFDAFLIHGPKIKDILSRYADLTGRAPMPPKWSFGFWLSRAGYRSRAEVESVVRELRARGFPCDVLSLDPWWQGNAPWCTYEWDRQAFPDPQAMMAWMREQGIRTCLWITPYLPADTPLYIEAAEKGYLIRAANGFPAPVLEAFAGDALSAVDFTNPAAVRWWQGKLACLMDMGASVFKTDFGEQAPVEAYYADGRSGLEMHNLYPLLYNRAAFELTESKNGRGLVWGRSGYAGSQRYPVQWGGDSYSTLDQLSSQLRGLLSYGLSGVPFCSHDVGGFDYSPHFFDNAQHVDFNESYDPTLQVQYPKDPVVYARWLQVGVFSSHLRAHGKQAREPWTYGAEVESIAHRYLDLRYRLLPYIYSEAVKSSQSGLPLVRPMVLEFQDDLITQRLDTQYMFGESIMVAPVLSPDNTVRVYLPEGKWVDFWSKHVVRGGKWLQLTAPLEILPLWVRAGAILPLGPFLAYVDQKPTDPLTIEIYAPQASRHTFIHDEGRPDIPVSYSRRGKTLTVKVGAAPGMVEVVLYGVKATSAQCDGAPISLIDGSKVQADGRSSCEIQFILQ